MLPLEKTVPYSGATGSTQKNPFSAQITVPHLPSPPSQTPLVAVFETMKRFSSRLVTVTK